MIEETKHKEVSLPEMLVLRLQQVQPSQVILSIVLFLYVICFINAINEIKFLILVVLISFPILFKGELLIIKRLPSSAALIYFGFYAVLVFISNLNVASFGFQLKNVLLVFGPMLCASLIWSNLKGIAIDQQIGNLFYFVTFIFFVKYGTQFTSISGSILKDYFLHSKPLVESTMAFVFGFFTIYFLSKGSKKNFVFALFMTFLGGKRIALASIFVTMFGMLFFNSKRFKRFKVSGHLMPLIMVISNLIFLFSFLLLTEDFFYDYVYSLIGVSPDYLFMGRVTTIEKVLDYIGGYSYFGIGIGKVDYVMVSGAVDVYLTHLHSDVIKLFFEFGILPFTIILYVSYRILYKKANITGWSILLYYNLIALTDNITIYFEVMFIMYVMIDLSMLKSKKQNTEAITTG